MTGFDGFFKQFLKVRFVKWWDAVVYFGGFFGVMS